MDKEKQVITFIDGPLNGQRRHVDPGMVFLVVCQIESLFPPRFSEVQYKELVPGIWAVHKEIIKDIGF